MGKTLIITALVVFSPASSYAMEDQWSNVQKKGGAPTAIDSEGKLTVSEVKRGANDSNPPAVEICSRRGGVTVCLFHSLGFFQGGNGSANLDRRYMAWKALQIKGAIYDHELMHRTALGEAPLEWTGN